MNTDNKQPFFLAPGSDEAVAAGCTCPILDNFHGRGYAVDENGHSLFWYSLDCRIHIHGLFEEDGEAGT